MDCRLPGTRAHSVTDIAADGMQDSHTAERKEVLQNEMSLYRCHTIFNCTDNFDLPVLN